MRSAPRRTFMRKAATITALILNATLLLAQQPPPADQTVTIRGETSLVAVPVQVRDSHGRPVTGLRLSDFHIFEAGQEQPLGAVDEIVAGVETQADGAGRRDAPLAAQRRTAVTHYVVLFDQVNTETADQDRAKRALLKAIGHIDG